MAGTEQHGHDHGGDHGHAHDHGHPHDHGHDHAHGPADGHRPGFVSAHNPGAGQGPVVLDIGGDVGALVLHTPAEMVGREIEISPAGRDHERQHVEVLPRTTPSGAVRPTAVFGALEQGGWTLWQADGSAALRVTVTGGEVVEARWPEPAL